MWKRFVCKLMSQHEPPEGAEMAAWARCVRCGAEFNPAEQAERIDERQRW